jgi:hypothetical protein
MRDAAALIILQMDKATGISALSEARQRRLASGPEAVEADVSGAGNDLQTTASEDVRDDSG